MNASPSAAHAGRVATVWIDTELRRWSLCLLIVIAFHVGLILGFQTWKAAYHEEHAEPPPGAMVLDLGALPGRTGHDAGNKPSVMPHSTAAKPLVKVEARKDEHFHRRIKLRAEPKSLPKANPNVAKRLPPSATTPPKLNSSAVVGPASALPALGMSNAGSSAGGAAGSSGGCCGGTSVGAPVGDGQSGSMTWQGLLLAQLEAHKRYPPAARERDEQGVAYLRFGMNRQGKVLSFSLEKSSGFGDLDQETLALIQRSQPLPPPPASITGNVIELVVPVQFELQQGD